MRIPWTNPRTLPYSKLSIFSGTTHPLLQEDLFKVELEAIVEMDHAIVRLVRGVNWAWLELILCYEYNRLSRCFRDRCSNLQESGVGDFRKCCQTFSRLEVSHKHQVQIERYGEFTGKRSYAPSWNKR